ncbi:hypothetical protein [Hydrogenophaga sp. PBL-H3]|uniref:hypothetical protein n=1 Tax=Hydrogenophaga sp. PBL-H3 TaxID=434010 RepID=UPI00132036B4|nr:hypothetical protein [Hydrogenophaga sp. PBL-H3]QHE77918.1 hypothetical protein F9Z45_18685 [Hydrogenophaga sp. PBL-H3]QHE82342.1 hypothetical protein F9Z44_18685 [Hydrogenophaga sp. PBL-H3]
MASSIPFDHPSLVLGHVVNTELLSRLEKIAGLQAKTDAAFERMNSFIAMRRGLSMTINELVSLGVDITDLKARIVELNTHVSDAARDYMTTRITNDTGVQQLREEVAAIENVTGLESPLDFTGVTVERLPLASDSIKIDLQYFSYGSNDDSSATAISNIESAIRESTAALGSAARDVPKAAAAQVHQQLKSHSLVGTIVITASATHRSSAMLQPLTLDVDKAVDVWNNVHSAAGEGINTTDLASMIKISEAQGTDVDANNLTLLTGANYGSSFIGMVHMVNNEVTGTGLDADQEDAMQEQLRMGGWLKAATGGFGVDESVLDNVRKLLSTQNVSSHVNLIVLGSVPSLVSSQLRMGVATLLDDPQRAGASVQGQPHESRQTSSSLAEKSLKGGQQAAMQSGLTQSVIQGLGAIDHGSNKIVDLNTLMNAFDNYITQASSDKSVGIPISFFFKKISKAHIARLWLDKYFAMAKTKGEPAAAKNAPGK